MDAAGVIDTEFPMLPDEIFIYIKIEQKQEKLV